MDNQDPEAAAAPLVDAELHFKNNPAVSGSSDITSFFASIFPHPPRTRHLVTNLTLEPGTHSIEYNAIYQRWSVADPAALFVKRSAATPATSHTHQTTSSGQITESKRTKYQGTITCHHFPKDPPSRQPMRTAPPGLTYRTLW
ncbi:nuclear transport factor 2 family protein [Pseudarthrobacter phenanthrenivorans]|uniref:nuclear transport factor 2 family protein n=1 Tax=Pseudarthrobacter phenanthrenivorans TaxID=361575 RepID=UPI002F34F87B